jgi:hypothetical protein
MSWSLYQLPTKYLIAQGFETSHALRDVVEGTGRVVWESAGVDVDAHARDVAEAFRALWTAETRALRADVDRIVERAFAKRDVEAAHAWMLWLIGVLDRAEEAGEAGLVLVSRKAIRRSTPGLPSVTERMRSLVPDVQRERARLAAFTTEPARLDDGEALLGRLVAASLRERDAVRQRTRAHAAVSGARRRFATVFRRLDADVARVTEVLGAPPGGGSRQILRAEARRRAGVARRGKRASSEPAASSGSPSDG